MLDWPGRSAPLGMLGRAWAWLRPPPATLALALVLAAVFVLQALWGGTDLPPLLTRMGSMVPARAREGEWWRFFACTFLHGGALHLALNLLVLWVLGRSLERWIGPSALLLVYFASGLAGSAMSSLFVDSQSVGASGAIWGLLGAEAALAFHPRPLLPPALLPLARWTAAANLGLSLLNSFSPHVDVAAHIGGGAAGGLMLLLLAAPQGSPRRLRARGGWLLPGVASVAALVFVSGLLVAQAAGRPWRLRDAPELVWVPLPGSTWAAAVPRQASGPKVRTRAVEFGHLAHDPAVVEIRWLPFALEGGAGGVDAELRAIVRQLEVAPAGLEEVDRPRVVRDDAAASGPYLLARYRHRENPEVLTERALGFVEGVLVSVDVTAWGALPAAYEGLAPNVFRSIGPR